MHCTFLGIVGACGCGDWDLGLDLLSLLFGRAGIS